MYLVQLKILFTMYKMRMTSFFKWPCSSNKPCIYVLGQEYN